MTKYIKGKDKIKGKQQEIVLVNGVPIKDKYPTVNDRYIVFSDEPYTGD